MLMREIGKKPDTSIPVLHSPVFPVSSSSLSPASFSFLVLQIVLWLAVTSNQATFPVQSHRQFYT